MTDMNKLAMGKLPHVYSTVIWMIAYSTTAVVTITGNMLVLLAVITTPLLQTNANCYIVALAVADLMVGLNKVVSVFWISETSNQTFEDNYWFCQLYESVSFAACITSVFTRLQIAIDRFLFIMHPFFYQRVVTRQRIIRLLACLFPVYILHALMMRFLEPDLGDTICGIDAIFPKTPLSTYINVALYCLLTLITFGLYMTIFRTASSQARTIHTVTASVNTDESHKTERKMMAQNFRLVKRMALVWGLFVCMWTPYFCVAVLRLHIDLPGDLKLAAAALATSNSGLNVVVYACQDSKFRAAFQRFLHMSGTARVTDGTTISTA